MIEQHKDFCNLAFAGQYAVECVYTCTHLSVYFLMVYEVVSRTFKSMPAI